MPVAWKCEGCGHEAVAKWVGPCPGYGCWSHIFRVNSDLEGAELRPPIDGEVMPLKDAIAHAIEMPRLETGIESVDFTLGGGFASKGCYILYGDAGLGKTSWLLQMMRELAIYRHEGLYVTGEQHVDEIALTAKRFGKFPSRLGVVRENDLDRILYLIVKHRPKIIAIDSAQTLAVRSDIGGELEIGSAMAIKTAGRVLVDFAKQEQVCIVLIVHVTKDGAISGPHTLVHSFDCAMNFTGRKDDSIRTLRIDQKNRFGKTPRQCKFEMTDAGLVPWENPPPDPPPVLTSVP